MKKFNLIKTIVATIWIVAFSIGCQKYLDVKPDAKLVVPSTLQDFQALLDNNNIMNRRSGEAAESSADDYYITDQDYNNIPVPLKRLYIWEKDYIFAPGGNEWSFAYEKILIANTVLDNINKVARNESNQEAWNDVKAQALFARAHAFLEIAITWTLSYDENTATNDLGIPLRLTSDINERIYRANLKQTYDQILKDLHEAGNLSTLVPLHPIRPSKPAVYALLARTYLAMRNYENCLKNADLCLQLKNDLLDFNSNPPLNPGAAFPFSSMELMDKNPEIIYLSRMSIPSALLANNRAKINNALYQSYHINDLRKNVYFKDNGNQTFAFKGSLEGSFILFNGLATDEVYLMRAECYARKGMVVEAMNDLNTLMRKRWNKNVPYPTFTASNNIEALNIIITERRKELLMRGLRWMDIKRLNKEGANITLQRFVNGQTYILPANDKRFALAIPENVISTAGIPQNPRD